ncbi:hypothetical protein Tco_0696987 [Tanacetum coccineum]
MTRGFGDLVAKLGDKVVMEVLVRCWSDGDVVPTSVPCTLPTQGVRSITSMVSISPEGFLPSILMLVVIIVTVVIVTVILICALVFDPLVSELCWWPLSESEASK